MDGLEDELDLRYHKGLDPDVYYRCPTLESLEGALRNEVDNNAASFIPTHVVTEFVFAAPSTITIPVTHQQSLDLLIQPADYPQSIAVEYALCQDIDGKDRLKVQRAISRSIVEAIQATDGFKYIERSAHNKERGDGARLKYVCLDSLQGLNRKTNQQKAKSQSQNSHAVQVEASKGPVELPTYDCGGAIHVKFSLQRQAINVVYKHNPIHMPRHNGDSLPTLATNHDGGPLIDVASEKKPRKRRRSKKVDAQVHHDFIDGQVDMSTSPEAPKSSAKKTRKRKAAVESPTAGRKTSTKKNKKAPLPASPTMTRKKVTVTAESPPLIPVGGACIRCREKKIKCNEAKPTCNQCRRGLWTCQYQALGSKKRSKNGCLKCKQRRRKCTEEKPSCAHCLRLDDDCEYADYS